MQIRRIGMIAVALFALLVAAPASAPVGISYVYSDSMAPTIGVNDGFIVVPAGDVDTGEVVLYDLPSTHRTAHRVVGHTQKGFVTKGDNNQITDQAAGTPYVDRAAISGQVLTVAGHPIIIPNLGVGIEFVRTHLTFVLGVLGALFVLDLFSSSRPTRSVETTGSLLDMSFVAVSAAFAVLILLSAVTASITVPVMAGETPPKGAASVGESYRAEVIVTDVTQSPVSTSVVTVEHATVRDITWRNATMVVTVRIPPQRSTGRVTVPVTIHHYPAVLPQSTLRQLQTIHPLIASLVSAVLVFAPLYLLGVLTLGRRTPLRPGRNRVLTLLEKYARGILPRRGR